ncbi:MAG: EamA family transporter [Thermodesulfobacteriota bacterium]|nr:EamA family transporter [Thermodesulfobacteriota bacterium]
MHKDKKSQSQIKSYLFIVYAAVLWASSGTASKYLFNGGMSPYVLVQYRVSFSAIIIGIYLLLFKPHFLKIKIRDLWYFVALGVGMGGVQIAYLFAISKINVAIAILLEYLAPFFVAIYSSLFFNETMNRWKALSILMAFIGCFFAVEAYNVSILALNRQGLFAGLLSAIFFSFYTILGERMMRRYHPWTVVFYAFAFSTLYYNIGLPPSNLLLSDIEFRSALTVIYVVTIGTLVPFSFYYMGIEYLRSTRASVVATLEPISAGIFSFILLGELLTPWQIFGGLLVIVSIIIIQLKKEIDPEAPAYKKLALAKGK